MAQFSVFTVISLDLEKLNTTLHLPQDFDKIAPLPWIAHQNEEVETTSNQEENEIIWILE